MHLPQRRLLRPTQLLRSTRSRLQRQLLLRHQKLPPPKNRPQTNLPVRRARATTRLRHHRAWAPLDPAVLARVTTPLPLRRAWVVNPTQVLFLGPLSAHKVMRHDLVVPAPERQDQAEPADQPELVVSHVLEARAAEPAASHVQAAAPVERQAAPVERQVVSRVRELEVAVAAPAAEPQERSVAAGHAQSLANQSARRERNLSYAKRRH